MQEQFAGGSLEHPALRRSVSQGLLLALASTALASCSAFKKEESKPSAPIAKPSEGVKPVPGPAPVPVPAPAPVQTEQRRSIPPPAPSPAPAPSLADKADIRQGDRLWYRGGEGASKPTTIVREVVSVGGGFAQYKQTDTDVAGKLTGQVRSRRQQLSNLELDNPSKASGSVRYLDFPLQLGKTWSYRYQLKNKTNTVTTYDIVARVEAQETISTPAGRFEAIRVLHGGSWNVPVIEKGVLKQSSGSLRSTVWFVPAIGNWVKFDSEILNSSGGVEAKIYQELIKFERRS